jgi:outer membrane protein OmpA-like peptidoglycan-associated protein
MITAGLAAPSFAEAPDYHDVVHSTNGNVVHSTNGNCVRTKWNAKGDECQPPAPPKPVALLVPPSEHRLIPDEDRTVYFEFNQSRLNETERARIDSLTTELKSMHDITGVSIAGYADRMGTTSYNQRLSEQRAAVVEKYMRQQGYLNTTLAKTRWLGESSPITECPASLKRLALISCLQKDRRVTIEVHYEESPSNVNPTK